MAEIKKDTSWSPYLAGAISGLVLVLSVLLAGKFYGASTSFVRTAGMIEKIFGPDRVSKMAYFVKEAPIIEWQWMFVVGIFAGSLIASLIFKDFQWKALPDMWETRFGSSRLKRSVVAFLGGLIAMYGARLADG